jgi:nitrate reductase NapE component
MGRSRAALPVVLAGVAVVAVATAGTGGFGRAHYLRQLIFGPAGPGAAQRSAAPAGGAPMVVPAIPAQPGGLGARTVARSPVHGHRPRDHRRGVLGPGGLPRRAR